MGTCKFCGQKTGLFQNSHKECKQKYESGKSSIVNNVFEVIFAKGDLKMLEDKIYSTAKSSNIPQEELDDLYSQGFDRAVENFLEDGIITVEEEEQLATFKDFTKLPDRILNKRGSFEKLIKSLILRDVMDGKVPKRITIADTLPFLLQKDESPIWLYKNVELFEQRTKTTYVGRSQGVSIRVAKGVYYRTGSFKGNPVETQQTVSLGIGILLLTNKNIYFGAQAKTIKIPYSKIIGLTPYTDGIGLQKDGATAKPQIFKNVEGWFCYNLISNINLI